MLYQIEITTKCNFRCFYCAGRDMPQRHMDDATFDGVLLRMVPGRHRVSLQGEGEPTLHPKFWTWAERVKALGHEPYTITNGSLIATERAARVFPTIGVSLDTVDPGDADRIGRLRLTDTLAALDGLLEHMGPGRVIVHTVDFGQDMMSLNQYLRARGIRRRVIQPLQPKADYAGRYAVQSLGGRRPAGPCRHLVGGAMRYFDVTGMELPCCFIKDTLGFVGVAHMLKQISAGETPAVCRGCSELPLLPSADPVGLIDQQATNDV